MALLKAMKLSAQLVPKKKKKDEVANNKPGDSTHTVVLSIKSFCIHKLTKYQKAIIVMNPEPCTMQKCWAGIEIAPKNSILIIQCLKDEPGLNGLIYTLLTIH